MTAAANGSRPIGMGCMRLSTAPERDEARALEVLGAALEAGVTLLDTADVYGHGEDDIGHNERLVARALAAFERRAEVIVATKGGLTRPGGRWVPNGKASHLRRACEASLRALGVDSIPLYQLHAPDPQTPLKQSVRALAALKDEGLCRAVGLCNVHKGELLAALDLCEIAAVQVALSLHADAPLLGGLVELCNERGILLLCHTPLGGARRAAKLGGIRPLKELAARHGVSPQQAALAWLRHLGPRVVPLPGATRVETARAAVAAAAIRLAAEEQAALMPALPSAQPPAAGDGEVVLIVGIQGAGKSRAAERWVAAGYERLNRDERGGRLAGLLKSLGEGLKAGRRRFVLDNTYPGRAARARVVALAQRHGVPVRCLYLDTSLGDAQVNAVRRLIERHGGLPDSARLAALAKTDPHAFEPRAQFRYQRELEPPALDEGFSALEVIPFAREPLPHTGRGLVLQIEGVLRDSASGARAPLTAADMRVRHDRAATLQRFAAEGYRLCGLSWQPAVAEGKVEPAAVAELLAELGRALGVELDTAFCPHAAGPPSCWCRSPLPGLVMSFVLRHGLDPAASIFVGRSPADRTLAQRVGFRHVDHAAFFAPA